MCFMSTYFTYGCQRELAFVQEQQVDYLTLGVRRAKVTWWLMAKENPHVATEVP